MFHFMFVHKSVIHGFTALKVTIFTELKNENNVQVSDGF